MEKYDLKDTWRLQHPDTRDFTFYSPPHNSYSRIDYILISGSHTHTHLIESTEIAAGTISDHSCISLQLSGKPNETKTRRWRLNSDILGKQDNRDKVEEAIKEYLSHNDTKGSDPRLTWDAMKATIRGTLIGIKSNMNKQVNKRLNDLENDKIWR